VDVELYIYSSRSLIESFWVDTNRKMLCNDNPTNTPSPSYLNANSLPRRYPKKDKGKKKEHRNKKKYIPTPTAMQLKNQK
jgi:hypothetical protein